LYESDIEKNKLIDLILSWRKQFSHRKKNLSWQPYNVSERICNWIVLIHFLKGKICKDKEDILVDEIKNHIFFLAENLEYPSSGIINNHVFNNARALYIGGLFINNISITNLAEQIIKESYDKLFCKSGFLNESSTHYHFLITRSILEIYLFAREEHYNDEFCNFIRSRLNNAVNCCKFLLGEKIVDNNSMPKIGDVSPDIPFEWFNPFSDRGWSKIWNYSLDDFYRSNIKNYQLIDGWLKLNKNKWTIFTFLHPDTSEYPSGHGHNDFASINLYHNNKPILIDIGCMSYDNKNRYFNYGRNSYDHNTLQINGKSLIEPGIGRKSIISSKLRNKCSHEYNTYSINWKGTTNQNISWKRKIELLSEEKIIVNDVCDGNNFEFMRGFYYISNYLELYSQNENKIILKTKDVKADLFEFVFDKDCEIKVKDSYFFSNYGIKENIKCINTNIKYPKKNSILEINRIKL